jgi:hypothetical protein
MEYAKTSSKINTLHNDSMDNNVNSDISKIKQPQRVKLNPIEFKETDTKNIQDKLSRKYKTDFRKKLVSKFDKIKDKSELLFIYNIIVEDIGNNFSSNRNGIFVNMNILSDNCIDKLLEFINKKNYYEDKFEKEKINYKTYKFDEVEIISEMGHKLSNQEKNIIKRMRNTYEKHI